MVVKSSSDFFLNIWLKPICLNRKVYSSAKTLAFITLRFYLLSSSSFFLGYVYRFERERKGVERERDRETQRQRNINWSPPVLTSMGDGTGNLGMCPDCESKLQAQGSQDDTPTK